MADEEQLKKDLDEMINSRVALVKDLCAEVALDEYRANPIPILTEDLVKRRSNIAVGKEFDLQKARFDEGMLAIISVLREINPPDVDKFWDWLDTLPAKLQALISKEKKTSKTEIGTMQESLGFPKKLFPLVQRAIAYLRENKRIDEALSASLFALQINPELFGFWFEFGLCLHEKGEYEVALYIYQIASAFDKANPYPYINLAKCWYRMEVMDEVKSCLEKAQDRSGSNPDALAQCEKIQKLIQ